jgi:carboxyl-terminal processing protease
MIASIDGVDTRGMSVRDAVDILRGDVGSTVAVGLRRASSGSGIDGAGPADDSRMVTLVREIVRTESVLGDRRRPDGTWDWFVEGEPGIACVRITSCGDRTLAELDAALATIAAAPALQGLVLDLRGNPGGLLGVAIDVCDRFLDDGVIVSTRRRGSGGAVVVEPRRATPGSTLAGVPIAVLIDGLTASAAEIVAACLQDHGRAVIVGSRSFGKGTVQSIIPLSDGRRLLKLTTAEYVRPDETSVQRRGGEPGWGVAPDVGREVDLTGDVREAHRAWRRRRDMLSETSPHHEASPPSAGDLPRGMDPALALAIDAIVSAATDFRGEEEAAGDADEAAAAGDAPGPLDGRGG